MSNKTWDHKAGYPRLATRDELEASEESLPEASTEMSEEEKRRARKAADEYAVKEYYHSIQARVQASDDFYEGVKWALSQRDSKESPTYRLPNIVSEKIKAIGKIIGDDGCYCEFDDEDTSFPEDQKCTNHKISKLIVDLERVLDAASLNLTTESSSPESKGNKSLYNALHEEPEAFVFTKEECDDLRAMKSKSEMKRIATLDPQKATEELARLTKERDELKEELAKTKARLWVAQDAQLRTYDGMAEKADAYDDMKAKLEKATRALKELKSLGNEYASGAVIEGVADKALSEIEEKDPK